MKNKFYVSCQALPNEPLHSSFIMGRLALAAELGGAQGIRANSVSDIKEIKTITSLPIIGIIKVDYDDSDVYITPTIKEIDELVKLDIELIAVDATNRVRPGNISLEEFFKLIKDKYPNQKWMADCATIDEMIKAQELGFDVIGTTLFGYTDYSKKTAFEDDLKLFKQIKQVITKPIVAEGNINSPELANKVATIGSEYIVVGSMITRPMEITKVYSKAIKG